MKRLCILSFLFLLTHSISLRSFDPNINFDPNNPAHRAMVVQGFQQFAATMVPATLCVNALNADAPDIAQYLAKKFLHLGENWQQCRQIYNNLTALPPHDESPLRKRLVAITYTDQYDSLLSQVRADTTIKPKKRNKVVRFIEQNPIRN
jgi:hypothetical protein